MDKRKPIAVSLQLGFLSILLEEILKNIDTHERSENLSLQKQTPVWSSRKSFRKKKTMSNSSITLFEGASATGQLVV